MPLVIKNVVWETTQEKIDYYENLLKHKINEPILTKMNRIQTPLCDALYKPLKSMADRVLIQIHNDAREAYETEMAKRNIEYAQTLIDNAQ